MSPIRPATRAATPISTEELLARVTALSLGLVSGADELDPDAANVARRVIDKVQERTTIAGDHTVVALAGATGSGKSSLFNAIVGAGVARVGARRPTTSKPTAAIFGSSEASELLDWLKVDARHVVAGVAQPPVEANGAASLDGLVLLDLPDFDSRVHEHRREAERVLELVDVFVWVTDPQKYADARLHDDFVRLQAAHEAVTLVVLNQCDLLEGEDVSACVLDLKRLLAADGVPSVGVVTTSARTGAGVDVLRQRLAGAVAGHAASRQRLAADVNASATRLRADVSDSEADVARLVRTDLDDALARAGGVPIVLDAVARDYRREAFAHTGWIFTRWTRGFAADPLRRLRLDRAGRRPSIPIAIQGSDVRAVLGRSSIPAPSVSTASAVEVATRSFVREAAAGLPYRWEQALDAAAAGGGGALADSLDQAIVATPLRARRPVWWHVVNVVQWLLGLSAVAGLLWLVVLFVLGFLQLPQPATPTVGVVPVPALLLVLGLLGGIGLGVLSRWWAKVGSRRRRSVIGKRLHEAVAAVTDARVIAPVGEVLERHRSTRVKLDEARA
ncbi:MAG: 50S ribosome-binding GTPase [Intrasporangium sp.]|uniref:GTPase family protein n=1 Tax=Intrasporangium sp. TaxID=1925024 RepID=UPI002649C5CA|nr:GTPase [Intrasporangium sp.]MDN5798216.1 50S ribosome-binding GTPase [Intrasporangium sp.]